MRLIDADELKRKYAGWYNIYGKPKSIRAVTTKEIDWTPTIDATYVVRCKDCAHGTLETEGAAKGYINCPYQGYGELHPQDWYCADGVRKGEEESDA